MYRGAPWRPIGRARQSPSPPRSRSRSVSPRITPIPVYYPTKDSSPEEPGENESQPVRHRTVFASKRGSNFGSFETAEPLEELREVSKEISVVLNIVTEYVCIGVPREVDPRSRSNSSRRYSRSHSRSRSRSRRFSDVRSRDSSDDRDERGRDRRRMVYVESLKGKRSFEICSPDILQALRKIVRFWSDDLTSETLIVHEPFSFLIHHMEELENYKRLCESTIPSNLCEKAKNFVEHFGVLQSHLDQEVMPGVVKERSRHERGYATFAYLWLLFKPGEDIVFSANPRYSRGAGLYLRGGVLDKVAHPDEYDSSWTLHYWGLEYNGSSIGQIPYTTTIAPFQGEIEVTSLEVIPANWKWHTIKDTPVSSILRKNGRLAFELLTPKCLQHDGKSKEFPFHMVQGLCMVDRNAFYTDHPRERPKLEPRRTQGAGVAECYCSVCKERSEDSNQVPKAPFAGYNDILVDTDDFTEHQSFLFPSRLYVLHLRSRTWELVDVADLSPAKFQPDVMDTLVMKPERIEMIKALSKKYMRPAEEGKELRKQFWSADFIGGKGRSQIILLHGKPGVGKTYTAECIAEYTKRPLITLTCADIGIRPEEIEENLIYHFSAAKDWGALILIDEADIYMERRSSSDLDRNSLVASFLRALEAFEGMLFLTTNRVGAFDDAFVSRIHVKLFYPSLIDEDRQKIWEGFISKLSRDRAGEIRVNMDAREYINGSQVQKLLLNGREIRNAFQTAVALAEYAEVRDKEGTICVDVKHVKQVVEMTKEFQEYLTILHGADEDRRAKNLRERGYEGFGGSNGKTQAVLGALRTG